MLTGSKVHLISSIIAATFTQYIPLASPPTLPNRATPAVRSMRDRVILLLAICGLQFLAIPPVPTPLEVLLLIPLTISSIVFSSDTLRTARPADSVAQVGFDSCRGR